MKLKLKWRHADVRPDVRTDERMDIRSKSGKPHEGRPLLGPQKTVTSIKCDIFVYTCISVDVVCNEALLYYIYKKKWFPHLVLCA